MVGKHEITIENAYLKYQFTICRNITVIRGDSATGKTTLVDMIRLYNEEDDTGISVNCDVPLVVVYGRDWKRQIEETENSIIFIDEQNRFYKSKEFAEMVFYSSNYYVIISREKLSELPYSVTEVYGIRINGKYAGLKGEYTQNEFFRIYGKNPSADFEPDVIITEDSGAGYDFWNSIYNDKLCVSASGKTNILRRIKEAVRENHNIFAVVDGAAFGSEMEDVIEYIKFGVGNVKLFAPESFEYLILSSDIFNSRDISDKCSHTEDYADSGKYVSWERFYTALLTEITNGTNMKYSKEKLNVFYLSERNKGLILKSMRSSI